MNNIKKFAFAAFYPVLPNMSGSSEVSGSFFKYWPNKNKKFFYITHLNDNNKNKKFQRIKIFRENPYFKIISLISLSFKIIKFLRKTKQPYLIIEGPSWIFYSYATIIIIKFFLPNTNIIYHSHSIEYEIRKKFNNKIISYLTYFLEKKVSRECACANAHLHHAFTKLLFSFQVIILALKEMSIQWRSVTFNSGCAFRKKSEYLVTIFLKQCLIFKPFPY